MRQLFNYEVNPERNQELIEIDSKVLTPKRFCVMILFMDSRNIY